VKELIGMLWHKLRTDGGIDVLKRKAHRPVRVDSNLMQNVADTDTNQCAIRGVSRN